jgi:hypothetical protein
MAGRPTAAAGPYEAGRGLPEYSTWPPGRAATSEEKPHPTGQEGQ